MQLGSLTRLEEDNEGDIYRSFVEVVSVTNCELLAEASNRNVILKSMNLMKLKNRERGSGVCKFNTLNGRWFGKTEKMSVNIENDMNNSSSNLGAKLIKRGTVVSFNWEKKGYFLVFEVWKAMNNNKWFPSEKDDKLLWPFEKSSDQLKKYRIGVRRLSIDENNRILGYMTDTEVEDGKNVHDVYRIVKDLASIVMIHYTVNI